MNGFNQAIIWLTFRFIHLDPFIPTKLFVLAFLSAKVLTQAYLVKKFITRYKHLTLQLKEDSDSISAKSAVQKLSLTLENNFLLSNILMNGSCNS